MIQLAMPEKMPDAALRLELEAFRLSAPEEGAKRKPVGLCISKNILSPHWYWGAMVFEMGGVSYKKRVPVLEQHDHLRRAGHSSLKVTDDGVEFDDGQFLENDIANSLVKDSDGGFPFQLSIGFYPMEYQRLERKEIATVNGQKVQGPATVFKKWRIDEVSFVALGHDDSTSAKALSINRGETKMDEEELKQELATAKAELAASRAEVAVLKQVAADAAKLARKKEVQQLFSDIGADLSDDDAKPYFGLSAEAFDQIATHLRATRKTPSSEMQRGKVPDPKKETDLEQTPEQLAAMIVKGV